MYARLPMFQRIGAKAYKKDLTNTQALLAALGNPQNQFQSIHIAGTNGKGSLTHMLGALFVSHGYKTGLYTSPHYKDFRERIKIGNTYIRRKDVVEFIQTKRHLIEQIEPSFFELTVAMAFWYFAKEDIDFAIIETGLGGRLDSTNVIHPELSLITNIGFDHMDILGHTLSEIATEKAGIIKNSVPVVIGEALAETRSVFEGIAMQRNAPIRFAEDHYQFVHEAHDWDQSNLTVSKNGLSYRIQSDLAGPYQSKNLITFLAAIDVLYENSILKNDIQKQNFALMNVRSLTNFIGRWTIIGLEPMILCDSAHNKDGLAMLFKALGQKSFEKIHIVFGVVQDKDLNGVLPLFPTEATYYFAKANVPRGLDAKALRDLCDPLGMIGSPYTTVKNALNAARRRASTQDLILVCGSIFVVAEVL